MACNGVVKGVCEAERRLAIGALFSCVHDAQVHD